MNTPCSRLLIAVAMLIGQCFCKRQYIELTHEIHNRIVTYPGMPKYNFTNLERGNKRGFWLEYNKFQLSEHAGTHIDAPIHFNKDGAYLNEVPLDDLIGPGVVIDISDRSERDRMAELGTEDILKWEQEHGRIPNGAFVIMKTGWFRKYPDTTQIFGVDINKFPASDFRYPGFSPSAAQWMVDHRDFRGIASDTPSPDKGGGSELRTHRIILGANKVILENVANLDKLPPSGFILYALPINLYRGSGGPIRLFATLDDGEGYDYGAAERPLPVFFITALCMALMKLL